MPITIICTAIKVIEIYENALKLSNENLRINERLLKNGKGLSAYVLRSQSEQETNEARIAEAKTAAENAKLYVNFLLNRNEEDSIEITGNLSDEFSHATSLLTSQPEVGNRPEIKALNEVVAMHQTNIRLTQSNWLPALNGIVDIGSQASSFSFTSQSKYYNIGIQLEMPLFTANRNSIKIKQAKLDKQKAELTISQTLQQFNLLAVSLGNALTTACRNYQSSIEKNRRCCQLSKIDRTWISRRH